MRNVWNSSPGSRFGVCAVRGQSRGQVLSHLDSDMDKRDQLTSLGSWTSC